MTTIPLNQIILGDCVKVLKDFPENSIDCVVTDPPYGLSFMGKEWDKVLPPKEAFAEMCRVLKPGALAFVMSSPRQDLMWRMGQLLEESGFELGQSFISWVYASGFPKAYDISLGIDSKFIREEFEKENKRQPIREELKSLLQEKRKNIGINPNVKGRSPRTGGELVVAGGKRSLGSDDSITEPASDEAKQWSGWKSVTGLKPAMEIIFMVQKPISEKTIVDNVLKWGTGAMNVDACRIPIECGEHPKGSGNMETCNLGNMYNKGWKGNDGNITPETGRFPANLLISDDALNDGIITKSVVAKDREGKQPQGVTYMTDKSTGQQHADEGSFCRFFNLDAWAKHHGFLNVPKASTSERDQGLYGFEEKECGTMEDDNYQIKTGAGNLRDTRRKNIHPTVKPVELMAYLIELGCPPSGVVLDPFLGSGTTCVAARMLGRDYVGIEISDEYHKIAMARVASTPRLTTLDKY